MHHLNQQTSNDNYHQVGLLSEIVVNNTVKYKPVRGKNVRMYAIFLEDTCRKKS